MSLFQMTDTRGVLDTTFCYFLLLLLLVLQFGYLLQGYVLNNKLKGNCKQRKLKNKRGDFKMKKIITMFLMAVMLVSLVACGKTVEVTPPEITPASSEVLNREFDQNNPAAVLEEIKNDFIKNSKKKELKNNNTTQQKTNTSN